MKASVEIISPQRSGLWGSVSSRLACLDENTIAAMLGGDLSGSQRTNAQAHLESCESCRQLIAGLVKADRDDRLSLADTVPGDTAVAGPSERLERVGRYLVLEAIGAGGMGQVYAAFDPVLERKVAIKLVRPARSPELTEEVKTRLLREGRSIAQLNHPNVVSVYDMGTSGDEVYVAMELVDGGSLKTWLATAPPPARVLEVFIEAGRGLAAAHRAGLVHRDFKPENVLLGTDGRVRVSDFGLSMSVGSGDPALFGVVDLEARLTQTGALVGTPAYMAPEQWRGADADALSDQFSFCVALWEALFGARPYTNKSSKDPWVLSSPAPSSAVPAKVRQALVRGLSVERANRFPSMDALLVELEPPRSRLRIVAAAVVALGLVLTGVAVSRSSQRCTGAAERARTVWSPEVSRSVEQALGASGEAGSAPRVVERLSAFTSAWVSMHTEACEATRVRGSQSDQLLTLRMTCLDQRLGELRAVVDFLSKASPEMAARAPEAVEALTPIASCADTEALLAQVPPPGRPEVAAQVEGLRDELAAARSLLELNRLDDARARAEAVRGAVLSIDYPPLQAETLVLVGRIEEQRGELTRAEEVLLDALSVGEAARHDRVRAEAATSLMVVLGVRQARYGEAHAWQKLAAGAIARAGHSPLHEARLLQAQGQVQYAEGKLDDAIASQRQAVARFEQLEPESVSVGLALNELGAALRGARKATEALEVYRRALAMLEQRVGAQSDSVAATRNGLANTLMLDGRFDEALALYRVTLEIFERRLGPKHFRTVTSFNNVGVALAEQRRFAEALPWFEKVVLAREAIAKDAKAADAHANLAMLLLELKRLGDAEKHLTRAKELLQGLPFDHFSNAEPLLGEARLLLEQGKAADAEARLERVRALCEGKQGFRFDYTRARADFLRARAFDHRGEHAASRALAEHARTAFVGFGERRFARDITDVSSWLAAHQAP